MDFRFHPGVLIQNVAIPAVLKQKIYKNFFQFDMLSFFKSYFLIFFLIKIKKRS